MAKMSKWYNHENLTQKITLALKNLKFAIKHHIN